jgi:putative tricarboxylic transport membrane protein
VLSVAGIVVALFVLTGLEKAAGGDKSPEIDYRRLTEYKLGQAVLLLAMMVAYALLLRPAGFILSTSLFLVLSAVVLGERNWMLLLTISAATSLGVWYLVQQVLDIFLRPLPQFLG